MERIAIHFDGESRGALAAARQASGGIEMVSKSARGANRELPQMGRHLQQSTRGALAGSGAFRAFGRAVAFASASFLGTAGLTYALRAAVGAASNLNEQTNKVSVVFRDAAKQIVAWSKTTATALGIASDQALEFAGTFGNLLIPMGLGREEAARMSKQLVELAADMASFNNATPEEVLEALRSGLAGEQEPLRRFGVFISQARVEAEAFSSGLVKSTVDLGKVTDAQQGIAIAQAKLADARRKYGEETTQVASAERTLHSAEAALEKAMAGHHAQLTAAQKALATYQIILKDTKDAQGDFGRTSDGLANQQRILHAQVRELEIAVGKALLPTVLEIVRGMNKWLGSSDNQAKVTHAVTAGVHGLITAVRIAIPIIRSMWKVADEVAQALGGWKRTLALLIALKLASWLVGLARGFTVMRGTQTAGILGTQVAAVGLLGTLRKLSAIGAIAIGIDLVINKDDRDFLIDIGKKIGKYGTLFGSLSPGGLFGPDKPKPRPTSAQAQAQAHAAAQVGLPGTLQLPATFKATDVLHDTSGLPGFPALDVFAAPGTTVGAPEDGVITRLSGHNPALGSMGAGGVLGYSIYLLGASGTTYFMTHFATVTVRPGQRVRRGEIIGTVAYHPRGSHIHIGRSPAAHVTPGDTRTTAGPRDQGAAAPSSLTVGATAKPPRTDITKIPPAIRTEIARAGEDLDRQLTAEQRLLKVYLKRQGRKGLTPDEQADLAEAIAETKQKIRDINEQLAQVIADENRRILDAAQAHPERFASVAATRGGGLVPGLTAIVNQHIKAAQRALEQAKAAARSARGEGASVLETLLGFDQTATVELQDKFGRAINVTIADVVAKVRILLDRLEDALANGNRKAIEAAVKAWGNYGSTVTAAIQAGNDAAARALEQAQGRLQTTLGRVASRLLTAFDRVTQAQLSQMQRAFQAQIDGMQKDLDVRIAQMQRELATRIKRIQAAGARLTPAEAQLQALQAAHDAEGAARDLAEAQQALIEAQAGGDPKAIAEAQRRVDEILYQQRIAALQKTADEERRLRDEQTAAEIERLQEQEAAVEQQLRDELAAKIAAMQDEEAAREQNYTDQREAQRLLLEDQLAAWQQNLLDGSASWEDFIKWLQGEGANGLLAGADIADPVAAMAEAGAAQGSAFAQAYIAELQAAWQAYQDLLAGIEPKYQPPAHVRPDHESAGGHGGFQYGGKVPGRYVGREDTLMALVTPEERVLDREFNRRLEAALFGGGLGSGRIELHVHGPFLGGTERQVYEAIGRAVEPYQRRIIGYKAPG